MLGKGPPFGAKSIAVVPFDEMEPVGVGSEVAHELSLLLGSSGVRLSASTSSVDGVLRGIVLDSRTTASPVSEPGQPIRSYQISLLVRATLESPEGKPYWSAEVPVRDDFVPADVGSTAATAPLSTEANRREALKRVAREAARALYDELMTASATSS